MSKPAPALLGLLALRQHRLNQAEGIRRVSPRVGLLLAAYGSSRGELVSSLAQAAYYSGLIQSSRDKVKALISQAETGDQETMLRCLKEAMALVDLSERAAKELDTLDFKLRHQIAPPTPAQE